MAVTVPTNVRSHAAVRSATKTYPVERGWMYYPSNLRTIYNDPDSLLTYSEWMENMSDAGMTMVTIRVTGRNVSYGGGACHFEPPPHGTYNIWDTWLNPAAGLPAYRAAQVTHPVAPATLAASNMQKLIAAAEMWGIGLWISFFEWQEFISAWARHPWNEANRYTDDTPCEVQDRGFLTNWYEMFDNPTAIQAAKDRIQFFIDTFGSSTAIQAWEIVMEGTFLCSPSHWGIPWGAAHRANIREKMVPWFTEIAQYIRDNDPLERPICPAYFPTQPGGGWPADPDDYWNIVNEINDIEPVEIVSGRGYYVGDTDKFIDHFRAMQERYPDKTVIIGEYHPYTHGVGLGSEYTPFYLSKEHQWICATGGRNSWAAVRWVGLIEEETNKWISGGYADTDLHDIVAITHNFQDFIDWSLWDDVNSEAWLNYISTGAAGAEYIMSWGDGQYVMLMINFTSSGVKTVTVSNLINGPYTLRVFNWVTGVLDSTQYPVAAGNQLSFNHNVTFYDNILVAFLGPLGASTTSTTTVSAPSTTTTTTVTVSTTTVSTTSTTTLFNPYCAALTVSCSTGLRTIESLSNAEIIDRNVIAAAAQGL